ncbi:aminopeptidase [Piscinibacter sakaiensis]
MRDFASAELRLPDNASYRRYAELGRASVVWNVVAAPELGLQLQTWCYPVVGCVGYRGYYAQADAEQAAAPLRAQGLEVQVYGVPAYSTLGKLPGRWFADPLLNTFLNVPEADLARLIFHELAHQVAYAAGDTVFNESFATAVERLGGERWLDAHGGAAARAAVAAQDRRREEFRAFVLGVRDRLQAVYAGPGRDDEKRAAKAQVLATMRTDYEQLKRERWGGFSGYDAWFARANNASFAILGAYHGLAPNFERLFAREGGDFERFYAEVRRLAALPAATRRSEIEALAR